MRRRPAKAAQAPPAFVCPPQGAQDLRTGPVFACPRFMVNARAEALSPKRHRFVEIGLACAIVLGAAPANAASRIKDIADVEGVRDNQLVVYGLVMGLQGTGDSLRNCPS